MKIIILIIIIIMIRTSVSNSFYGSNGRGNETRKAWILALAGVTLFSKATRLPPTPEKNLTWHLIYEKFKQQKARF